MSEANYYLLPSGIECYQVAQEFPYNVGTAIAYLWRAGKKPGATALDDLRKAQRHIDFEIKRLEEAAANGSQNSNRGRDSLVQKL